MDTYAWNFVPEERLRSLEEIEKEDAIVDHEIRRTLVYEIREREHHLADIEKRIISRGEELEDLSGIIVPT